MEKLRKLFGEYPMTWPKVILFAVITAVYTAFVNELHFLRNTSFQDIAITLECWFLFAIFIVVNTKKWWEASLKCFAFFLISQPLIYLLEVPFEPLGWGVFGYYRRWFILTLLTLPGAVIAFLLKKKNWLSAAVLCVPVGYLALMCASYTGSVLLDFPHHLLSAVFCLVLAILFVFILLDEKRHRIAVLAVLCVALIGSFVYRGRSNRAELIVGPGVWEYSIEEEGIISVSSEGNGQFSLRARHVGDTTLTLTGEDGTVYTYSVIVTGGGVWVSRFD